MVRFAVVVKRGLLRRESRRALAQDRRPAFLEDEGMKTTYTAWAVQVLRDGEWEWYENHRAFVPLKRGQVGINHTRIDARLLRSFLNNARVRKVRVTVEEV
jgi:hypothetical protein